jgi:hypothetical protein
MDVRPRTPYNKKINHLGATDRVPLDLRMPSRPANQPSDQRDFTGFLATPKPR